ncbi:unnamed protein product [Microthlaspi erraticum]|uniref:Uncharacterized protein n=1 Tax=Microthlaspi erraticum TaxID=1685480 RepID=A0A6D2JRB7_9BRAS|nr:unnamed protein product [Microthlaspi erraticum]
MPISLHLAPSPCGSPHIVISSALFSNGFRHCPARAGKQGLAAAQPVSRTTADASVRAGKNVPRPAEKPSAKSHPPTSRPTVNPSGHDRSDSATTRLSGRSSRPTVPTPRSTRSPF